MTPLQASSRARRPEDTGRIRARRCNIGRWASTASTRSPSHVARAHLPRTPAAYPDLRDMNFSAVRRRQCVRQLGRLPTMGPARQLLPRWVAARLHPQFTMPVRHEQVEERQEKLKKVGHPAEMQLTTRISMAPPFHLPRPSNRDRIISSKSLGSCLCTTSSASDEPGQDYARP